jgi:ABC-type lipoprotein release transport system permease subunit
VLRINGEKGISASYISPESAAGKIIYKGDGDGVMLDSALFAKTFDAMNVDESTVKAKLDAYNSGKNDYLFSQLTDVTGKGTHTSLVMHGMKIKGVVEGGDGTVYVDNESFRTFVSDSISVDTMLIKTKNGTLGNQRLIKELKTIEATPDTKFYTDYMTHVSNLGMLSTVFSRLLVMISVAAALLRFSFISSSVKLESRQIGILRGMGARGIDTFKAFGIEGLIITAISLVITVILLFIFFPVLNAMVSADYAFSFFAFVLTPYVIPALIITSLLITAVAVTAPLLRLVSLMPVDTMNKNENQR